MESSSPRLIAFYLPQFYPIPENDLWWEKGFTDWINVTRARPAFAEHYQPHLPADLGFYDLRLPETREAQARLAAAYGLYGFCYHHYWFQGRRLLERPFEEVMASGRPDFPFCLCWANENWTRSWDGSQRMVLLEQRHSNEDDVRFIQSLLPAFRDPRYIKVNGKPLLIVYHSQLLPDPAQTTARWRDQIRAAGFPDLHLIRAETHTRYGDHPNAAALGFDGALEFPPHAALSGILRPTDPQWVSDSESRIFDYREMVLHSLRRPSPDYKLYRGVMPSWDNTPRRSKGGAYIFAHSSPELYEQWLAESIRWTRRHHTGEEQMVFINAWNEWGEGCHLEPDQRYGHRFLEATRNALLGSRNSPVTHTNRSVAGDDHRDSGPGTDEMTGQTSQLLLENLYLKLQLRNQSAQTQDLTDSTQLVLVPQLPTLDNFLAQKLLAEHPRFRRIRKALYRFLKPLWGIWLAGRTLLRPDNKVTGK